MFSESCTDLALPLIPQMQTHSVSMQPAPVLASAPAVGGAGFPGIVGQLFLLCLLPLSSSLCCPMTALVAG